MNSPRALRLACRSGRLTGPTAALAPGFVQANLGIVPVALADEFEDFLNANPAAFPLLARGMPGNPSLPALGEGIDLRRDLPRYRVFQLGRRVLDTSDITEWWRDDLVAFAIGCSLSFEADLVSGGVALRCHGSGLSCSAFDSALPLRSVGAFGGNLVVTMRAVPVDAAPLAEAITRRHPLAHGGPVHIGDPTQIGVDLSRPIDGIGLTDILPGEVAMFWPCGVSLERALTEAAPELSITHAPGHMLITDLPANPSPSHTTSSKPAPKIGE